MPSLGFCLILASIVGQPAAAQSIIATVSGTVYDEQRGVLAGAAIGFKETWIRVTTGPTTTATRLSPIGRLGFDGIQQEANRSGRRTSAYPRRSVCNGFDSKFLARSST